MHKHLAFMLAKLWFDSILLNHNTELTPQHIQIPFCFSYQLLIQILKDLSHLCKN